MSRNTKEIDQFYPINITITLVSDFNVEFRVSVAHMYNVKNERTTSA